MYHCRVKYKVIMEIALLFCRLLIGAVFATAGVAKLADPEGSREALKNFGLPKVMAGIGAPLLPLLELAIAIALLPLSWAVWGAWGALALLLIFIAAMGLSLARGQAPDCHCFGQLHSEPVSAKTIVRNILLAACAGAVVWLGPGVSAFAWTAQLSTAEVAIFVVVLGMLALMSLQSGVMFQMMRQNGRMLTRLDELESTGKPREAPAPPPPAGLAVGAGAPLFSLATVNGAQAGLADLMESAKPALLIFTDPNCGPCAALLPELARWENEAKAHFTLALLSRGTAEANLEKFGKLQFRNVLLQKDREVAESFQSPATPSAVIVEADGRIGSPVAVGTDSIRALVARTINAGLTNIQLKQGDLAPVFTLPDSKGELVSSAAFRGMSTLLVFWNDSCGYCKSMLPEIKKWESRRTREDPQMVVVATGDPEPTRKYGLRSQILLDESAGVSKIFNSNGTPTGVLLDKEGRLVSETAIGSVALFELADSVRGKKAEVLA